MAEALRIEVCYALPERVVLQPLQVPAGTSMGAALAQSGVLEAEGIALETVRVGLHGKVKPLDTLVRDGDRIEIYRPLQADPKDARRRRAVKEQRKARTAQ